MTRTPRSTFALLAGAALIVTPAAALAQTDVSDQAEKVTEKAEDLQAATNSLNAEITDQAAARDAAAAGAADDGDRDRGRGDDDDDDSGKWGWLGLLGLAGLLGLRRRDDHVDHDRRTEHRRDADRAAASGTRTGTGTDTTRL